MIQQKMLTSLMLSFTKALSFNCFITKRPTNMDQVIELLSKEHKECITVFLLTHEEKVLKKNTRI